MKISELIAWLQEVLKNNGDLTVLVFTSPDSDCGYVELHDPKVYSQAEDKSSWGPHYIDADNHKPETKYILLG